MSKDTTFFSKITGWLDQTPNATPLGKRLGAYAIDWALGGIFCGFPAVLMYGSITGKSDMFSDLYVFEALGHERYWGILAGLLCILFALVYYVYIPWKVWEGQTLGKRALHLRIEKTDGNKVELRDLLLRQVLGIFLLEGSVFIITGYIRQLVTLTTRFYVDAIWQYIGIAITLLSAILVVYTKSHRALHDYIAGTKVIEIKIAYEIRKEKQAKKQEQTIKAEVHQPKAAVKPKQNTAQKVDKKRLPKKQKMKK